MPTPLPIAIISPHGSLAVPPELAGLSQLTSEQIFNEADAYIDDVFDFGERVRHTVTFPYARALVDVNRALDSTLNRPGDGIVKAQTSYGASVYAPDRFPDAALCRHLLDTYWRPWHEQLDAITHDKQIKLVIDAHSMAAIGPATYDDPSNHRPRFMVGNMGDASGNALAPDYPTTAPAHMAQKLASMLGEAGRHLPTFAPTGATHSINHPFRGGWVLRQHGGIRQPWLMVEVSRALYVGEQTGDSEIMPAKSTTIRNLRDTIWQVLEQFVAEL